MPYKTEWVQPEVAFEHKDVTIYHTYRGDDVEYPYEYWFTTNQDSLEGNTDQFDIRKLDNYDKDKEFEDIFKEAIENGEITDKGVVVNGNSND